jgi:hypothetical protein
MKTNTLRKWAFALITVGSLLYACAVRAQTITITYPQQGTVLDDSATNQNLATITWNTNGLSGASVNIILEDDQGNTWPITPQHDPNIWSETDTGSYVWPTDTTLPNGTYHIYMWENVKGGGGEGTSGKFIVTNSPLTAPDSLASFQIRSCPDQPQQAIIMGGQGLYVATFEIIVGDADLYGGGAIGGIFSYTPSTTNSSPDWEQWVESTDMLEPTFGDYGNQGYAVTLPNNTLDGVWVYTTTNTVLLAHTTNVVYVELGLDYGVDWQQGDTISFVSSNFCHLSTWDGATVYASGIASNTVTLINDSKLKMTVVGDTVSFHGSVPAQYSDYQLEESTDLINWTPIPGSDNYDRTVYEGDYYFTMPFDESSSAKFYRLTPSFPRG